MPRALIVDDVAENLYLLQSLLAGNGYEVLTARNGAEALDQGRRSLPDLIVSDILMPTMDGFALCRQWKQDAALRKIPFVFYTATYTDPKDEQLAMSIGADLFIVKPTEPETFLSMIREMQSRLQAQDGRVSASELPAENTYLREYNEALIRKLEDKLLQLEDANKALAIKSDAIESSISGIAMISLSGNIAYANNAFAVMWGKTKAALFGMPVRELIRDEDLMARIEESVKEKGNWSGEFKAERSDESAFFVEAMAHTVKGRQGNPICRMVSCIDITERQRMQEELQRAEKLESLDVLAGGIAHDFNNLLAALFGNIELARMELPSDSPASKRLEETLCVFDRAKDLAQQLLTYAKGNVPATSDVKVDELLQECCRFSLSGSNIEYHIETGNDLAPANADPGQLSQVFTNILINARQAMTDGGTLAVSIDNCTLGKGHILHLPAGKYVRVAIRDSGGGICKNVLPRIFDPFFTTKPHGSGLGLATSYRIIKNHDGHIKADSTPGVGTTFTIWLPAFSGIQTELPQEKNSESIQGDGRILVMDDEKIIRDLAARMLRKGGYEVDLASSGEEALDIYKRAEVSGTPFDAIILDLTIRGGMGGMETASALRKLDANVGIIISSGYSSYSEFSRLGDCGFIATIPKPYLINELLDTVKGVVSRRRRCLEKAKPSHELPGSSPIEGS